MRGKPKEDAGSTVGGADKGMELTGPIERNINGAVDM